MNKNNALCTIYKTGLRFVLIAVLSFIGSFFVRAQESVRVYYPFDNAVVNPAYLSNAEALKLIDNAFSDGSARTLEIVSYSSPEGNCRYNENLSGRRAEALRVYLLGKYPQLEGKISVNPHAECWDDLRSNVEADNRLSADSKRDILAIIDSDKEADAKEAALKAMPAYKALYSSYFRQLRYAEIRLGSASAEAVESGSEATVATEAGEAGEAGQAGSQKAAGHGSQTSATLPSGIIVNFPLRGSDLDSAFNGNAEALQAIEKALAGRSADEIESITINSYASPEGPLALNDRYSIGRGKALQNYITNQYPAIAGKVSVRSAGEAWEDLRLAVESDSTLSESSRSQILSIIVSNAAPDTKEAKLRSLPEWEHLFEEIFPSLRYARFDVEYRKPEPVEAPAEPAQPVAEPAEITVPSITESEIEVEDEAVAVQDSTLHLTDTTLVVPVAAPVPANEEPAPYVDNTRPIIAASTNLVYDFGGLIRPMSWTPNFALEIPIGQKWSVYGEYAFPWWVTRANDQAWQVLKWDIGARRWLSRHNPYDRMDVLRGHFIGIDLGAGYYDIEPKHTGYQGEFQTASLEYGYAFRLGRAWRLDLFGGIGWLGTHYRYYEGDSTDQHLLYRHHGKMDWFGPVKAGISIKYIFHKSEEGRNEK